MTQHGHHLVSPSFLAWVLSGRVIQTLARVPLASGLRVYMAVTFSLIFNEFVLLRLAHHLCFSLTGSHFMFGDITEELPNKQSWLFYPPSDEDFCLVISLGAVWLAVSSSPEQDVAVPGKGASAPDGCSRISSPEVLDRIHLGLYSEVALLIGPTVTGLHVALTTVACISGPAALCAVAARSGSGRSRPWLSSAWSRGHMVTWPLLFCAQRAHCCPSLSLCLFSVVLWFYEHKCSLNGAARSFLRCAAWHWDK